VRPKKAADGPAISTTDTGKQGCSLQNVTWTCLCPMDGSNSRVPAETPPPSASTGSRRTVFVLRAGSTLLMWAIALGIIFSGQEIGFFVLIAGLTLLALWEFYRMLEKRGLHVFTATGLIAGLVSLCGSFYFLRQGDTAQAYDFELCVLLLFVFGVFARQFFEKLRGEAPLQSMAYTLFGLLYIVWLFSFVTKLVYLPPRGPEGAVTGHWCVLYLVVVTKFCDMGAYLTGMLFGKHPMVPAISPKKTVEGFIGALVFSVGASLGSWWLLREQLPFLHAPDAVVLGLLIGVAAVIGDLAESLIKRSTDAKDSGSLLPGIGGVLDLIDSLLFTAPVLYFYLRFVAGLP